MPLYNNPYLSAPNPYASLGYVQQQQPVYNNPVNSYPHYEVPRVNGMDGANAFQMGPNSSIFLLDDSTDDIVIYMAVTDSAGYKTITRIDGVIHQDSAPHNDTEELKTTIQSLDERIQDLQTRFSQFEEMMK